MVGHTSQTLRVDLMYKRQGFNEWNETHEAFAILNTILILQYCFSLVHYLLGCNAMGILCNSYVEKSGS